ncbi:MAG: ornithine cyclodeaminase family protein [Candidatus Bathyarchaeia archaeon]
MVLLLARSAIESLVNMREAICAVEEAFREYARGEVQMPPRSIITIPERGGWIGGMSAYLRGLSAAASKVVASYPNNALKGLPTISALITYIDIDTGIPLAVMDAAYLTALRTGAASGVATKYLAREDSETVGVIGAGVQARFQLEAVAAVRRISRVYVYSPTHEHRIRFAKEVEERLGVHVTSLDAAAEVVCKADILVVATSAKEPVVKGKWLRAGTHINGVGSHSPKVRELDGEVVRRSKVVVDSREAALREAGDLLIPMAEGGFSVGDIYAELGEVVSGAKHGRESPEEVTLFKSVGLAIQDVAVAKIAYDKARRFGVGSEVKLA